MKKGLLFILGAVLVGAAVLFSCQKTDLVKGDEGLTMKVAYAATSCETECINEGGPYFEQVTTQNFNANPFGSATVTIWNTPTAIVYKIESSSDDLRRITFNGTDIYSNAAPAVEPFLYSIPLGPTWAGCDEKTATIEVRRQVSNGTGAGVYLNFATSYKLIPVCQECVESFSYKLNGDGSYTFTYIPAIDVVDALLVFTFPQGALDTPLTGWNYNGQTMQTTMNLKACQVYNWTVSLSCKDLNNPQNKWTDFKVGLDSKKGNLVNIPCK
jgi:hypothetical protein